MYINIYISVNEILIGREGNNRETRVKKRQPSSVCDKSSGQINI